MKILIIPSWYPKTPKDISGSFFREQAIALNKQRDVEVTVLAPRMFSILKPEFPLANWWKLQNELDCHTKTIRMMAPNLTPRFNLGINWQYTKMLNKMLKEYVEKNDFPDLIHVHSITKLGVAAQKIAQRYNIPIVYSEHSSAFTRSMIPKAIKVDFRRIFLGANRVFAVSKPFADLLTKQLDLPDECVEVMPNSVNRAFITSKISKSVPNKLRFLHVSTLEPNKNVSLILDAFAKNYLGSANVSLKIVGNGSELEKLKKRAESLRIADSVDFVGFASRSKVVELMESSDAFLLSSQTETFGVVVIEALAMGLPVIATRCGGPEDILTHAEDGILVPNDDVNAYSNAMKVIEKKFSFYSREARRHRCICKYSEQHLSEKWIEVYSETLGKGLQQS